MAIVVTGATGNVGRPLVDELVRAGAAVRAVSRHPATAGLPGGVAVSESVLSALPGADALFLNSRALGSELAGVVARARAEGVSKVVALSAINVDDDFSRQPSRYRGDRNRETEDVPVSSYELHRRCAACERNTTRFVRSRQCGSCNRRVLE